MTDIVPRMMQLLCNSENINICKRVEFVLDYAKIVPKTLKEV